MSLYLGMDKQTVIPLYHGILSNKNEQGIDTCYNMDGSRLHCVN